MKRLMIRFLLPSALLLVGSAALGKPVIKVTNGNDPQFTKTWITAAWTGDNIPYVKTIKDIDAEVAHGQTLKDIVGQTRAKAQKNRLDPHALFAYGYAVQKAYESHDDSYLIGDVYEWLSETKTENVYEYTRLRFLLAQESYPNGDNYYLKDLGERLLKHDPKDEQVRTELIYALCTNKKGLDEALSYVQKEAKEQPNSAKSHHMLAYVYCIEWDSIKPKNYAYAEKALAECQKYLAVAKPDDSFYKMAPNWIKYFKIKLAERSKDS